MDTTETRFERATFGAENQRATIAPSGRLPCNMEASNK